MSIRFNFGGDEHIFGEVSEEMSLASFFTGLSMINAVRQANIRGVTETCPANASFQITSTRTSSHRRICSKS